MNTRLLRAAPLLLAPLASADTAIFTINGGQSAGPFGTGANTHMSVFTAPAARVTAVSWDLTGVTNGLSHAAEGVIALTGTDGTRAMDVRPFACDFFAGATSSAQAQPLDVSAGPLAGTVLFTRLTNGIELRDGWLNLELTEIFEDPGGGPEMVWNGTVTVHYEPNGFCPSDWNYDGGVDSDDVIAFFTDWDSNNADYTGDGGTDGDDIIAFFAAWDGGC